VKQAKSNSVKRH